MDRLAYSVTATAVAGGGGRGVKVGSLFSGIGGIDLGFERAGFEIAWQVEIDPWCRKILAKHWPDVPRYEDVTQLKDPPYVDVLAGGFPCQDVSVAGKGAGIEGSRSGLWFEFSRLIRELQPRYVFVENVPGLLVRGLDRVLGELAESGYDAEWDCIPASALGAPHRRDRVWIVAYPHNLPQGEQVFRAECEEPMAHPNGARQLQPQGGLADERRWAGNSSQDVAYPASWDVGEQRRAVTVFPQQSTLECSGGWESEPDVGRVAHGIPRRVDRLRGLGNAVVPQVVEWIARSINLDFDIGPLFAQGEFQNSTKILAEKCGSKTSSQP